jgi:hypothetical protein
MFEQTLDKGDIVIFTSPTPSARVAENAYRTFTVGTSHFAVPSSLFWDFLRAGTSP